MKYNFKIGDHVRIRQWDDMASEYDSDGYAIGIPALFVSGMKPLCGKEAVITGFEFPNNYHKYTKVKLEFIPAPPLASTNWDFSPEMLELIERS